jgi:NAD(P)-dependent dehydrogenase (short-subunit alcohol dehydrogenase family)
VSLFDLTGRVALVTGGARGLGEASSRTLARLGAVIVLSDIDAEAASATADRLSTETGAQVLGRGCDVTDPDDVDRLVSGLIEELGRLDILVNNAGIHRRVDPLDYDPEDVEAILAVNFRGAFQVAARVGREMTRLGGGSIVNISALGGGIAGLGRAGSVYCMTKGGLVSLTRELAAEWGSSGVRVNALAPGWIRTPMTEALQNNSERSARVMARVPLGRWGEADDVAGAVAFLASDASTYITGHTIPVDGGVANVISLDEPS